MATRRATRTLSSLGPHANSAENAIRNYQTGVRRTRNRSIFADRPEPVTFDVYAWAGSPWGTWRGGLSLDPITRRVILRIGCAKLSFQGWLDSYEGERRIRLESMHSPDIADRFHIGIMTLMLCAMHQWPDADWRA